MAWALTIYRRPPCFALIAPTLVDAQYFSSHNGNAITGRSAPADPSPLGLAIVKVAGGDREILEALLAVAWQAYQEAGCPFGATETGMDEWWAEQLRVQTV